MHKFKRYSWNDKAFYIITILILTIFFIMVLYPCIFVVSASFSSGTAVQAGKVVLFPVDFSLEGYKTVFNTKTVWIGFANSLFYTFVGTAINVAMTMTLVTAFQEKIFRDEMESCFCLHLPCFSAAV